MPRPKIVVAIDFSSESEVAVRHAVALGRAQGAEVVLVHAGTVLEPSDVPDLATITSYRKIVDDQTRAAREGLEDLRVRIAGQGVEVSHAIVDGFPDTTIPSVAEEIGAGTIVLGTHGRTGLKWFLLGSVAQRVVRLARCDVLVARGEAPAGGYRRICVATDFSPSADHALETALTVAAPGAQVDLVHCWHVAPVIGLADQPSVLPGLILQNRDAIERALHAKGEALLAAHHPSGFTMGFHSIFADARSGLIGHLDGGGYDLVALGSHGRRGVRRFVLGSVAEAVTARAPCSSLVVHGG